MEEQSSVSKFMDFIYFLMRLVLALFASYLSLSCSNMYSQPERIAFAILAGMFAPFYIPIFYVFRKDLCY